MLLKAFFLLLGSFTASLPTSLSSTSPSSTSPSSTSPSSTSPPLSPSQDPWYTAPAGYESASPGEILRIRPAPGNLTTLYSNSSAAYNILYRTTGSHYQPFWAVTTLFVPKVTNGFALLSYQIPYNSADVDGSSSYLIYAPVTPENALLYNDVQTALANGWFVNIPDYNGPLTSFGCGVLEGMATLDSLRAVRNADDALSDDARIALWGYSGGTIASENAAELHSAYASELNIVGAALGGLVSNLSSAISVIPSTRWAGLLPEVTLGLFSQYPEAMEYLLSQLKNTGPFNRTGFLAARNFNIAEAFAFYFKQDVHAYFKSGADFYDHPIVQNVLKRETYMGFRGIPQMPLFFYHAVQDEITHISNPESLFERYCSVGVDVLFERNTIGGHLAEATNGDQSALEWLERVLGGADVRTGCVVKDVALNVTDSPL